MKIYRVPVGNKFRPDHQDFIWPPQNATLDMGVEQDFDNWLLDREYMLTDNPYEADWMYIPIFWNRYYINNWEDGHWGGGIPALSEEVERCKKFNVPKFTISEADIKILKPEINWGDIVIFVSSRRDEGTGIDIPLLSAPHPIPQNCPEKKWIASFLGNLMTDGVRIAMHKELEFRDDCRVEHAGTSSEEFARTMLESYIALCPRGQGAQSYRMYEAMQLGTVPLYISDLDCRPFKKWIDWEICSLYTPDVVDLNGYMDVIKEHTNKLLVMGKLAEKVYREQLAYGKWCKYVIKELELL